MWLGVAVEPISDFLTAVKPFYDIGATGLLVLAVVMILTGRLVPRSVLTFYVDAYNKSQEAHAVKDQIIIDLAEAGSVSARALDAIPTGGGEPDAATTAETRRRRRQG